MKSTLLHSPFAASSGCVGKVVLVERDRHQNQSQKKQQPKKKRKLVICFAWVPNETSRKSCFPKVQRNRYRKRHGTRGKVTLGNGIGGEKTVTRNRRSAQTAKKPREREPTANKLVWVLALDTRQKLFYSLTPLPSPFSSGDFLFPASPVGVRLGWRRKLKAFLPFLSPWERQSFAFAFPNFACCPGWKQGIRDDSRKPPFHCWIQLLNRSAPSNRTALIPGWGNRFQVERHTAE